MRRSSRSPRPTGVERRHRRRAQRPPGRQALQLRTADRQPGRRLLSVNLPAGTFHYYCTEHGSQERRAWTATSRSSRSPAGSQREGLPGDLGQQPRDSSRSTTCASRSATASGRTGSRTRTRASSFFGDGDEPVNVKPGKTYKIQARTENVNNDEKRSGWSPTLESGGGDMRRLRRRDRSGGDRDASVREQRPCRASGPSASGDDFFDPVDQYRGRPQRREFFWALELTTSPTSTTCARTTSSSTPARRPMTRRDVRLDRASAGKYHYYCEVHGSKDGGMDGNIEILPNADAPSRRRDRGRHWASPTAHPRRRSLARSSTRSNERQVEGLEDEHRRAGRHLRRATTSRSINFNELKIYSVRRQDQARRRSRQAEQVLAAAVLPDTEADA